MKMYNFVIPASMAVLLLTACGNKEKAATVVSTVTPTAAQSSADKVKVDAAATTKPVPTPEVLQKEGTSSDVKITVVSAESKEVAGDNEFLKSTAKGVFKIIKLTLVKNQKNAIIADGASFKLVDDQKREYSTSSDAMTSIGMDKSFFLKKIDVGQTLTGYVAFDVPKDAKGFYLKAQGGMTGKEIKLKLE